jgi:hypothetical protein
MSTDSTFIAMTVLPYGLMTVNATTGVLLKAYKHSSITYPKFFSFSGFLYATSSMLYTGYTDNSY